jgi:Xaa-Pro aminopeptidase
MSPPPPPPPPPPPLACFPFGRRPRPHDDRSSILSGSGSEYSQIHAVPLVRTGSYSPAATLTEKLTFVTDSESYSVPPFGKPPVDKRPVDKRPRAKLVRSSTQTGPKRSDTRTSAKSSVKWGYGWGVGKAKELELEREQEKEPPSPDSISESPAPKYEPPKRQSAKSSGSPRASILTKSTGRRSSLDPNKSTSTLVGTALERKINEINAVDPLHEHQDISYRLDDLRTLMQRYDLDY